LVSGLKEVKRRFINHIGCPEFPLTELDNIITCQPFDWITPWNILARAYRFAFPHKKEERHAYEEYIMAKLIYYNDTPHFLLVAVNFDKVVRHLVGSRRGLELSDFQVLQSSYFCPVDKNYKKAEVEVSNYRRGLFKLRVIGCIKGKER